MDAPDVWVAGDDGTQIIRARDIAAVALDGNGNVTARLTGQDGAIVTLIAHRTDSDGRKPGDLHRQLLRIAAQLSDSSVATIVRPVHEESLGWVWVSEPL